MADSLSQGLLPGQDVQQISPQGRLVCSRRIWRILAIVAAALLGTSVFLLTCPSSQQGLLPWRLELAAGRCVEWCPEQGAPWASKPYEMHMDLTLPHEVNRLREDVHVHSDQARGHMRLSFYSGANVFITQPEARYRIQPQQDRQVCKKTWTSRPHYQDVLPDLDFFIQHGVTSEVDLVDVNGVHSKGYKFTYTSTPDSSPDSGALIDHVVQGYAGNYTFFVNASAGGAPLNFSMVGHNQILESSHFDNYVVVYRNFHVWSEGIDDSFFKPPLGMPCESGYGGSFTDSTAAENLATMPGAQDSIQPDPLHDLVMILPGTHGDKARKDAFLKLDAHVGQKSEDPSQRSLRVQSALRTYAWIQAENRRGHSFVVGVNHLIGWLPEERRALLGRLDTKEHLKKESHAKGSEYVSDKCAYFSEDQLSGDKPPEQLDLRDHGLVGPVKDQATCGSCWAFAVIAGIEGQVAKKTGSLQPLSTQQLIDCSWPARAQGCGGGWDWAALSWVLEKNEGQIATEEAYGKYLSVDGFCHYDLSKGVRLAKRAAEAGSVQSVRLESCWHMPDTFTSWEHRIEVFKATLVQVGPLSVAIYAGDPTFYYYAGGIYDYSGCGMYILNHEVLLIGYSNDTIATPYWLLQNQWSDLWGEKGRMRIARANNICGVMSEGSFVTLA